MSRELPEHNKTKLEKESKPDLGERILAAILTPTLLYASVFLFMTFWGKPFRFRGLPDALLGIPGSAILITTIGVPALIGFLIGFPGITKFIIFTGHLFYSNMEHERDFRKTLAAWAMVLFIGYLIVCITRSA